MVFKLLWRSCARHALHAKVRADQQPVLSPFAGFCILLPESRKRDFRVSETAREIS